MHGWASSRRALWPCRMSAATITHVELRACRQLTKAISVGAKPDKTAHGEDCSPTERQRAVSEFSDAHEAFDNAWATAFSSPITQSWKVVPAGSVSVTPTTGIFASWAIRTMRCAAASLAWLL